MKTDNKDEPEILYHGSMYCQNKLQPGFKHTGKIVKWDVTESNMYLYATSVRATAIELGFASAVEKMFDVTRFISKGDTIRIESTEDITEEDLHKVIVYVYAIPNLQEDKWVLNDNDHNGITTEYKTSRVIRSINSCMQVNIKEWIKKYKVTIVKLTGKPGLESWKEPTTFKW